MQSLRAGPRRPWVLGHQVLAAVSPGDSPQLPPEAAVLVSCPRNVVWNAQESIGPANGCPVGDAGLLFSLQCKPRIGPGVGGADHSPHWRRGRGPHSWAEAGAGLPLCPVCLFSVSQILPQICPAGLFGGTSGPWTAWGCTVDTWGRSQRAQPRGIRVPIRTTPAALALPRVSSRGQAPLVLETGALPRTWGVQGSYRRGPSVPPTVSLLVHGI